MYAKVLRWIRATALRMKMCQRGLLADNNLYRALRQDEIVAGFLLIPKSTAPFVAPPRLPNILPVNLAPGVEHALREHQWDGKFPTRGVSTTPHLNRAVHYAQNSGVIVRLDVGRLLDSGIQLYRVSDHVPAALIVVPEDDEVVLVSEDDGPLPAECVVEVLRT